MLPLEVNVYLQNNDHVRELEALLEDSKRQEEIWRQHCKAAEMRLADAQHINMELIDMLKSYGFKYRRNADMRTWYLPKDVGG
ncbi:MAG: hypothetical protein CVU91_02325 [Firmicutes bacterium HGW-Firmicutes-16]|nr:MAG: hypothetical protein CVU91_02325 [Firmicutes bacterium HGW-Firmicutes-16]